MPTDDGPLMGAPTQAVTRAQRLNLFSAGASTGLTFQLTRLTQLDTGAYGSYSGPLGESQAGFAEQYDLGFAPSVQHRITQRYTVSLDGLVNYQWFSTGTAYLLNQLQVGQNYVFSRRTSGRAQAGVAFVHALETPAGQRTEDSVSPVGLIGLGTVLYQSPDAVLSSGQSVGVQWSFDPVLATSRARAVASWGLSLALPPDWTVELSSSLTTSASTDPQFAAGGDQSVALTETTATLSLPIGYRISDDAQLSFGGRASAAGPHLSEGPPDQQVEY
jgi:hypothetical protein